jgi:restriction endonuclease S subunit
MNATAKITDVNDLDFISKELIKFIENMENVNFKLSSNTDNNKIFMAKINELKDRFDPIMVLYKRNIIKYKYKTEYLGNLLKYEPQYGANESGKTRLSNDIPRYIRITDIDEYGLLKEDIGVTAENIDPKYILKNNDILFARSGSVGKTYIHKTNVINYPCFFAGYLIRFVFDEEKINPDYIFAFTQLEIYKKWILAIQRIAAQPNINIEEYKSLKIPVPPLEKQIEIAEHIIFIRNQAKQLQQQAKTELEQTKKEVEDLILGD